MRAVKLTIDRRVVKEVVLLGWLLGPIPAGVLVFVGVPLWTAALAWFLMPFATLLGMVIGNELPV